VLLPKIELKKLMIAVKKPPIPPRCCSCWLIPRRGAVSRAVGSTSSPDATIKTTVVTGGGVGKRVISGFVTV
jgi:hypothetical protein